MPSMRQIIIALVLILGCGPGVTESSRPWLTVAAAARDSTANEFSDMERLQSGHFGSDPDRQKCDRASYSQDMDKCVAAYTKGNAKEGDTYWRKVLHSLADCKQISELLRRLNARLYFMNDASNVSFLDIYQHLLDCTENTLGKEHRFVADVCVFYADSLDDKRDFAAEKHVRERIVKIRTKSFGGQSESTANSIISLCHVLVKLRSYSEAEKGLQNVIAISEKQSYPKVWARALNEYKLLLIDSGREREISQLRARYGSFSERRPAPAHPSHKKRIRTSP